MSCADTPRGNLYQQMNQYWTQLNVSQRRLVVQVVCRLSENTLSTRTLGTIVRRPNRPRKPHKQTKWQKCLQQAHDSKKTSFKYHNTTYYRQVQTKTKQKFTTRGVVYTKKRPILHPVPVHQDNKDSKLQAIITEARRNKELRFIYKGTRYYRHKNDQTGRYEYTDDVIPDVDLVLNHAMDNNLDTFVYMTMLYKKSTHSTRGTIYMSSIN